MILITIQPRQYDNDTEEEKKSTSHKLVAAFWIVSSLFNCVTLAPIMVKLPYFIIGLPEAI